MAFDLGRRHGSTALSALTVAVVLGAGIMWRECLLLGVALFAGHRLFLWRMDLGAPWEAWRAGIRCVAAGTLGLLASVAVLVAVLTAQWGIWPIEHDHAGQALMVVVAAGLVISGIQVDRRSRWREGAIWTAFLLAMTVALEEMRRGFGIAPCVLTGALAGSMAWRSWNLARSTASDLFRAA